MLYTFLMDYRGGTYVSQVRGVSISSACKKWVKKLDISSIKFFNERMKKDLLVKFNDKDNQAMQLKGMRSVFFTDIILGKHIAYIHIITTQE